MAGVMGEFDEGDGFNGLCSCSGEKYKGGDQVWSLLKDVSNSVRPTFFLHDTTLSVY